MERIALTRIADAALRSFGHLAPATMVAVMLAGGGCATTTAPTSADVVVTAADAGRTVRLAPGEHMLVELLGNPSTGRAWELRSLPDAAILIPDGTRWVAAKDDPAGDDLAKVQQLRFVAQGPGRALLVFEYVEPSAPAANASSFSVSVEVASP